MVLRYRKVGPISTATWVPDQPAVKLTLDNPTNQAEGQFGYSVASADHQLPGPTGRVRGLGLMVAILPRRERWWGDGASAFGMGLG